MFKLGNVDCREEVVEEVVAKRCQLEGNTEGSPGLLSPVKVKSGVKDVETPVPVRSLLISCMIELRMMVGPGKVDGEHVARDPVVEKPEQDRLTSLSGGEGEENQLQGSKGVLQKKVLVALEDMEHSAGELHEEGEESRKMGCQVLPGFFQDALRNREEVEAIGFKSRHLDVQMHVGEDMVREPMGDSPVSAGGQAQVEVEPSQASRVVAQVEPVVSADAG